MNSPEGIAGLQPREPVGAVLSVGVKDSDRGFPVEKDRFHLLMPKPSEGTGNLQRRVHHPAYRAYNSLPKERRQVLYGALVHAKQDECFEHHLKAQKIPGLQVPHRRPACVGDGITAQRFDPRSGEYVEIQCPHERCQYRAGNPPPCKPFMRLLFRIVWPEGLAEGAWPSQLMRFTSGGWNTVKNALGLFKEIEAAARALRLREYSLYGLPFSLTLVEHTNPEKKSRFPVVHFSLMASPEAFFMQQHAQLAQMGERFEALEDMRGEDVVYEDTREISLPSNM